MISHSLKYESYIGITKEDVIIISFKIKLQSQQNIMI